MSGSIRSTAVSRVRSSAPARTVLLLLFALWQPARSHEPPIFSAFGEGGIFIRGDADQNGKVEITDAVTTLGYLFLGTEDPYCMDALDADDDGQLNLTDAIGVLS